MAKILGRAKKPITQQQTDPTLERPAERRTGRTGSKHDGVSPKTMSTYGQRQERSVHQSPSQKTLVGRSPANINVGRTDKTGHDPANENPKELLIAPSRDVGRSESLVRTGGSDKQSVKDEDQIDGSGDDTDLPEDYTDDDSVDDARAHPKSNKLLGLLGDLDVPQLDDPNAIDANLVGRADIGIPDPRASTGLRTLGGATAGAAIGTVAGAAAGTTFGGTVLASVAIGAGIGSLGFGVGAAIGAGVGLIVGIGLGIAYGRSSAKAAKADYLDTSQQGTVQRASKYGWLRTIMPKHLGRRLLRLRPTARSALGRMWNTTKGCWKNGHRIKMEDRGRNARASEAREHLRYAVASKAAYTRRQRSVEGALFTQGASSTRFRDSHRADPRARDFLKPIGALTDSEITTLLERSRDYPPSSKENPKKYKAYVKDQKAYDRKAYKSLHKNAVRQQSNAARTNAAFEKNEGVRAWDFKTIGPRATPGSKEHDIFRRLPASLQQSLESGDGVFRDEDTGNNVRILYDTENDEVVMAFNGTGGGKASAVGALVGRGGDAMGRAQNRTNFANYAGGTPPSVKQAVAIGKAVREAVQNYNYEKKTDIKVVSTGHSRGGLLATVEAVKNKGKAVTFNSEGMGAGVRDYCGIYSNDWVSDDVDVTVYSTRNELASGKGWASGIGTVAEFTLGNLPLPTGSIGVPPVIIGKRRILPKAPGCSAHGKPSMHMANLAGGAHPPRKARMRWGREVNRHSLYKAEPDDPV